MRAVLLRNAAMRARLIGLLILAHGCGSSQDKADQPTSTAGPTTGQAKSFLRVKGNSMGVDFQFECITFEVSNPDPSHNADTADYRVDNGQPSVSLYCRKPKAGKDNDYSISIMIKDPGVGDRPAGIEQSFIMFGDFTTEGKLLIVDSVFKSETITVTHWQNEGGRRLAGKATLVWEKNEDKAAPTAGSLELSFDVSDIKDAP